ncbi:MULTISPECIES: GNAT family N-acetyltransferase [Myxococcaceae]|uniref:GNAT family N-acetyltransferase n=1 Tax=Myxococcaceae TaxID=31 RepID=UPI001E3552BD|nr:MULTISPECIES: GNAT family N-acetyltransferase [Myxococcaceae]
MSEDYFRCEQHLAAEGVTHSLVLERGGEALWLPLVVRRIEGTPFLDAVSPYGLPGARIGGLSRVPPACVDWEDTGLVSIFVRERLGEPHCFEGGTARNPVCLLDPAQPLHLRESHARHIRRNLRLGFDTTCKPVCESSPEEQEGFKAVYRETMVRDRARERYFFSDAWFAHAFRAPAAWLLLTRTPEGHIASAALAVRSDGFLHYYVGGTASAALALSPAKNTLNAMGQLAARLGLTLHLGGGLHPGDALEHFKRGFANATACFYTHELVCNPAVYARLSGQRAAGEQFPAYRAEQAAPSGLTPGAASPAPACPPLAP